MNHTGMDEQDIQYAFAKQVPDMKSRGFIIGTSYGEITVPAGRMADALALSLTRALQCELLRLERHRHHSACCNTADEEAGHGH